MSVGLVLEGGGMRGIYTAGVLEYFLEKEIDIPYVIAVSAGACNGTGYVAKQKKRNFAILTKYINDPRYISLRNFIKKGCIFDFDFIIDELGNKLEPLNIEDFFSSSTRFITGATDIVTAKPVYCEKEEYSENFNFLRASCSQPFLSKIVDYKGKKLLDGGIVDPIPIRRSIEDGNEKNIIVLTRHKGYQKKREYSHRLCKYLYGEYPELVELLMTRDKKYNETLEFCYQLQAEGKAVIIQPEEKLLVNRLERNREKLVDTYRLGIHDAKKNVRRMREFLSDD
ncbi:putative patatin/cPLA2 family phospholipase [Mobilisporobacter senegalensis]|uniref:Putative patatin/cPLA2 family phospholipase n=1 Tax=Mobilisporobacter senegalensis TaxID=1329262 RepID=A0A3N1XNX7_9FIRM|nr:patatin family protein [Mobilisporobacter senegalensis]ROR28346.1 putative patatin/cPLA2 family phospholipase [Mobilisporobacter senegalensis]